MLATMTWINCGHDQLEAIRAIFNDAIANTTALYENEPRTPEFMAEWFAGKHSRSLPVIGALADDGTLMGFGTYGPFRPLVGFRHTVEHSLYIASPYRGQGLGRQLLQRLIELATAGGYHTMLGMIDGENDVSIKLHEALGFQHCGRLRETGCKFGRWLDVVIMQRMLPPG